MIRSIGKTNKEIAKELIEFIYPVHTNNDSYLGRVSIIDNKLLDNKSYRRYIAEVSFYGYYSDYDWVLFCSLFDRMIDLPKGFPMYCNDLKQILDNKYPTEFELAALQLNPYKYPQKKVEHHALCDAKWNLELYNFLNKND